MRINIIKKIKEFDRSSSSIERNLINSISLIFGVILLIVFICVDRGVDIWVQNQFDQGMIDQANYLKSQIKTNGQQTIITFDKHFMPGFKSTSHPRFFQLWQKNKTLMRSKTLQRYPQDNLIHPKLAIGKDKVVQVVMPNGALGRASLSYFIPLNASHKTEPFYLTIYRSAKALDNLLWLVDILLVSSFILAMGTMRYITKKLIIKGLKPLEKINEELINYRNLKETVDREIYFPIPQKSVKEIAPIRHELNEFIHKNNQLVDNEKRITADIAHELKTPLAEMITLSEVHITYPKDQRISQTYAQDMLNIAQRMKAIVENLLLLQKASSSSFKTTIKELDLINLMDKIKDGLRFKYPLLNQRLIIKEQSFIHIQADEFSLSVIIQNLIDNSLFYSSKNSPITIVWHADTKGKQFIISNQTDTPVSAEQIKSLTKPLYQIDSSRTNIDHYGLGLSIVKKLCEKNNYQLSFSQNDKNEFSVSIGIANG
ncbi:sensor histidine kinase [Celerinatantimonas diazotrophica]|uniref:histidine kinase n=1 Tax=Celerinatantimonas diazotrophica TaxID=412034 RepID=A0A4R1JM26_9GAMM|nr:HAMP domain-containing sensor histidine kinase [Celerinatantimonas diazotrophica]TCK52067.1 signal transduction histidine kinase [Celerinatantimonas diazotrophica]CAG9296230.1 Adaptive-response sensory-kinase SasA [Celerinatantimonas diazotrophica]